MVTSPRRPISGEEERILLAFGRFLSDRMSPASVAAYQSDVRLLVEETGANLLLITEAEEDDYIEMLYKMRRKERTIQRKGTAFRYFREFLASADLNGKRLPVPPNPVVSKTKFVANDLRMLKSRNALDAAIRAFVHSLGAGHSRSTVRAYRSDLMKFRQHLRNKTDLHHVSKQLISDFINEQVAAGLNTNSAARLLSTIRSLFLWLQQNGLIIGNPTHGLRVPRSTRHSPVPSMKDHELMVSAKLPSSFPALRGVLIVELLYKCGLGVSEVSALDTSSVDLKKQRLMVRGRRDRQRYLHLWESTVKMLGTYLPRRREIASATSAALVTNLRGGRLTERSVARVVGELASSGALPEGTHPYTLRQAFASQGLRGGKDIQEIRHDLGVTGSSAVLKIRDALG